MRVASQYPLSEGDTTRCRHVANGDSRHLKMNPGSLLDGIALCLNQLDERGTDVAAPEDTDSEPLHVADHEMEATGSNTFDQ